jgi:ABC-type nitrate/sulfonate/bicarbonate transport system ATPase subunit
MQLPNKIIVLENVKKSFGNETIIQNFSMSIEKGKIVCFVGPNGCGKTTILRLITGVDTNFDGEISINGVPPLLAKAGIVPQNLDDGLLPWRSVADNIAISLELQPITQSEKFEIVHNFILNVELIYL